MSKWRLLDLFSGIGGFSLGLERSGNFETVAFCEIEDYPRRVLRKHWPKVPIYDDIRTLTADRLAADGIGVDVICGGFPCQDVSFAGPGTGLDGKRSGLWREYRRIAGELRPEYIIVENVRALLGRGMGTVLGDLAALGYDCVWDCIPANYVGAPHERERIWIVAHRHGKGGQRLVKSIRAGILGSRRWCGEADMRSFICRPFERSDMWPEPLLRRGDDGLSGKLHRLKGVGNAVIPQIPEIIGKAIGPK